MSSGADEERVLELVAGKQLLFDNVVSPDAEEEVVGVSRRTLEQLAETLDDEPQAAFGGGVSGDLELTESVSDAASPAVENGSRETLDRQIDEALAASRSRASTTQRGDLGTRTSGA